ncbi:MAG: glycerol-3-phosphate 1-O-acyltransferase PlsY, partial [Calditrichia bacterium]|nr:glycerol-3-phosphate 1-O-acyltransferase PlsY [Calditrichia bacterium]
GSIPTAIIVSKYIMKKDVREHGSKNAGATNVFRVLGWKPGLFVLLFDIAKGLIATILIYKLFPVDFNIAPVYLKMIAGISAVFGHIWTVFAKFKGGKGVATGAGMLIGLAPKVVFVCILIFIMTVALTKMVSAGSIVAAISFFLVLLFDKFVMGRPVEIGMLVFGFFVAVLITYTHRSNLIRIFKGEENKISLKKSKK